MCTILDITCTTSAPTIPPSVWVEPLDIFSQQVICFTWCVTILNLCFSLFFVCHYIILSIFFKVFICVRSSLLQLIYAHCQVPEFIFSHLWDILKFRVNPLFPYYPFVLPQQYSWFINQHRASLTRSPSLQ